MAWLLLAVCASCKVLNIACGLIGWQLYLRRIRKGDVPQTGLEITTAAGPTENSVGSTADQGSGISNPAAEAETSDI